MIFSRSNKFIATLFILLLLSSSGQVLAQDPNLDEFARQSRSISANFAAFLIRTCELEVESIGLYAATEVCRLTAPQVYYEYSVKHNIILNLVSLTPRNVATGHADAWEQAGLLKMQEMLKNNQKPEAMEIVELVQEPAQTYYRYMKPMVATSFCLKCHGSKKIVGKELADSIKYYYPNDTSLGYELGDLIGAISIKKVYRPTAKK